MLLCGLKASELISLLQKMIEEHGDQYVFHGGGGDYLKCVEIITIDSNSYAPKGCFKISAKNKG